MINQNPQTITKISTTQFEIPEDELKTTVFT